MEELLSAERHIAEYEGFALFIYRYGMEFPAVALLIVDKLVYERAVRVIEAELHDIPFPDTVTEGPGDFPSQYVQPVNYIFFCFAVTAYENFRFIFVRQFDICEMHLDELVIEFPSDGEIIGDAVTVYQA